MGVRVGIVAGIAASVLALAAGGGLAAPAGEGEEDSVVPVQILGGQFSFTVAGGGKSGRLSVAGAGRLDPGRSIRLTVRGALRPRNGAARSFLAAVLRWHVDYLEPRTTLTLTVQVVSATDPACPVGTQGTVTVVDDDTRTRGRRADTARVRFVGTRCRAFERSFANDGTGASARVEIALELEPAS